MIFQPHRYSRTAQLFEDFINVLKKVDSLILLDIYPASEKPITAGRILDIFHLPDLYILSINQPENQLPSAPHRIGIEAYHPASCNPKL